MEPDEGRLEELEEKVKAAQRIFRFTRLNLKSFSTLLIFLSLFAISLWLMFHSFSLDRQDHLIRIGYKIWSDFAANLPLIRSFSFGDNWPPEYPIYPGRPIQYHFLFYAFVGSLERIGVPLDWALNLPSAFGFFLVLAMIYKISEALFSRRVGLLAVFFALFNGSLGFIQHFQKNGYQGLGALFSTRDYTAMGPWDGGNVLGVWHLNVFLNQRHFCLALGILFAFIWICLCFESLSRRQKTVYAIVFGVLLGLMPQLHKPVLLMFAITMGVYFIADPKVRKFLFAVGVISLPFALAPTLMGLHLGIGADRVARWSPGFHIDDLSFAGFAKFWFWNWGLHVFLIPIGFVLAPRKAKIIVFPSITTFLIGSLFVFSSDRLANHKFFNFSLFFLQIFSAFALIRMHEFIKSKRFVGRGPLAAASLALSVGALTLSGAIDFIAVVNDNQAMIKDLGADPVADWFFRETPADAVVLNSGFFYHPASIAGRKIFLGWPYFITTAGYDFDTRSRIMKRIYSGEDPVAMCGLLKENSISYLTVQDTSHDPNSPEINELYFLQNYKSAFVDADRSLYVYRTGDICP